MDGSLVVEEWSVGVLEWSLDVSFDNSVCTKLVLFTKTWTGCLNSS